MSFFSCLEAWMGCPLPTDLPISWDLLVHISFGVVVQQENDESPEYLISRVSSLLRCWSFTDTSRYEPWYHQHFESGTFQASKNQDMSVLNPSKFSIFHLYWKPYIFPIWVRNASALHEKIRQSQRIFCMEWTSINRK